MQDVKQTRLANYEIKEVPKELGDYLCVYRLVGANYPMVVTLKELKNLNLTFNDFVYNLAIRSIYVEPSLATSKYFLYEAEDYLGMSLSVEHYRYAPKELETTYHAFYSTNINTKIIRVVPELSESSKELFNKLETMQTTYQPETDTIEEANMQEIKNLNAMMEDFNMDLDVDLNVNIPTWLNTVPTLVWKLDQEANVMLFADEQFDTFTLKDVKNDISLHLTFEQVKNLGIIYSANYD